MRITLIFLLIYLVLQFISFNYYSGSLLIFKYLIVNILGNILTSFLMVYSIKNLYKALLYFISLFPFFSWYKSVFFINIDVLLIDPFLILLLFFNIALIGKLKNVKKFEIQKNIFFIWLFLVTKFIFIILFYFNTQNNVLFFINETIEPLLFFNIIICMYVLLKNDFEIFFKKMILGIFTTSFFIFIIELFLRSSGKPWLFLLHGGRRFYAGTSGDLTAGFGEPVTMGIMAAFFVFYFIFKYEGKYKTFFMSYLLVLVFISLGKSAILVLCISSVLFFVFLRKKIFMFIQFKYLLLGTILSLPLIGLMIERFLGTGNSISTSVEIDDMQITTGLNLAHNISTLIHWADPYINLEWNSQLLLLPLVGGIVNISYLDNFFIIFIINIFIIYYLVYIFVIKGDYFTRSIFISYILIVSYYGVFTGTVYQFYFNINKLPELGYVPRMEPIIWSYLIIILLIVHKKKKKGNSKCAE